MHKAEKRKILMSVPLFFAAGFIGVITTPYMGLATTSYSLMVLGVLVYRNRKLHLALMSTVALIDLSLVLTLQFQRTAIQTALSGEMSILQIIHIVTGTMALLLYGPTLFMGFQAYRSERAGSRRPSGIRPLHVTFGKIAFWIRTISFLFMFSLVSRVTK